MASFFSKLFSGFGGSGPAKEEVRKEEVREFGEYRIIAAPIREGGQFRLAGRIERDVNGETKVHEFIRADMFTSLDEANDFTFRKGEQIITQGGEHIFSQR